MRAIKGATIPVVSLGSDKTTNILRKWVALLILSSVSTLSTDNKTEPPVRIIGVILTFFYSSQNTHRQSKSQLHHYHYYYYELMAGRATTSGTKTSARKAPSASNDDAADRIADISLGKVFIVVLTLAASLVGLYIQVTKNISESFKKKSALSSDISSAGRLAASLAAGYETLVVADNMDAGYLDHIIDALLKFNHQLSFSGLMTLQKASEENLEQLNLIWTHDYPFQSIKKLHLSMKQTLNT